MAPAPVNLCLVLLLLLFLSSGGTINTVDAQKTWCVAKPSTSDTALKDNIEYACSQVDCSVTERGKPCFYPDTLISHASVAMNLYYQSRGRNHWNCYFNNSAVTTVTDPSYGACKYA
ncbi:glucan endo-1,3-beta-D-glucosidase-like [Musa acuminata AAA Group]|uniref:glucan endo-1,3-beta-D-glucosidase-like n=1 Tax=Musa acuminata AAA Group TaxID=214697 RepID=UPI0031D6A8B9